MKRLVFLLAVFLSGAVGAQGYPSRALKMVVPGRDLEAVARPFAEKLASVLGHPVKIENRPGDAGVAYAARQRADGYTLLFAANFLATDPPRRKSPPYDPLKDLAPVTKVATAPTALAIRPGLQAANWKELVQLSKDKPLTFAASGTGPLPRLAGELLNLDGAIELRHGPRGKADVVIGPLSSLAPPIRAGKLRGIAVIGPKPSRILPDLPTIGEAGGPNLNADLWYGLFVPAGTPAAIIDRLHKASREAIASDDLIERLRNAGYEPEWTPPQVLGDQVKSDLAKWARVVREAKLPRR
jgi:tripartite-type tricarboxylate transporter receptor subunit TctC